jgi:hypothetical protein
MPPHLFRDGAVILHFPDIRRFPTALGAGCPVVRDFSPAFQANSPLCRVHEGHKQPVPHRAHQARCTFWSLPFHGSGRKARHVGRRGTCFGCADAQVDKASAGHYRRSALVLNPYSLSVSARVKKVPSFLKKPVFGRPGIPPQLLPLFSKLPNGQTR